MIYKLSKLNVKLSFICCNNLPGVHTKIFILLTTFFSISIFFPPINKPSVKSWPFSSKDLKTSNTYIANSLVGNITIAPNPSKTVHFFLYKFSITGITKLKVFPLPVLEAANISRPAKACGITHL